MAPETTQDIKTAVKETVKELITDEEFIDRLLKTLEKILAFEKTTEEQDKKIKTSIEQANKQ